MNSTVLPAADADAGTLAGEPAAGRFYRPELDGLRFFAFVAVYIEHTFGFGMGEHHHLPNWIGTLLGTVGKAGTFGVDLFFVLSSYLITELLLRERSAVGHLDVGRFYIRRILRIWPLYFLFLFFAYALTFFVPSEQLTWKHLLGFVFFAGNWVYFLMPITTVAGPLWSVSLEEQFYLIWPWVIRKSSRKQLAFCALALMLIAFCARLVMGTTHPDVDWVSKNSFTRIDGIAVGALLALYLHGGTPKLSGAARGALFFASIATLLFVTYAFKLFTLPVGLWQLAFGWPLGALACGGILVSVLGSTSRFTAPLRTPVFIYLGRISYGLYVYHEVFLLLGSHLFPAHDTKASQMLAYWAFGFCATLPVAMASYQWLELPFLRLKRRRYTVVASRPD